MYTKYFLFLIVCMFCSRIDAEEHWVVGAWDTRSWGAIRLYEEPYRYAVDVDPDGEVRNYGVWQDFDKNSVLIVWVLNNSCEIIEKNDDGKFYFETAHNFGVSGTVMETKKIHSDDKE